MSVLAVFSVFVGLAALVGLAIALRDMKGPVLGLYHGLRFDDGVAIGIPGLAKRPNPSVISIRYRYLYVLSFITRESAKIIFPNRGRFAAARLGLLRSRIFARGLLESETARRWQEDDYLLAQQLEFHAPEVIAACPTLPEVDRERLSARAPELAEAAKDARLFLVDYGPMLEGTEPFRRPGALLYPTRAYIVVRGGRPALAAIAWDGGVALPGEAEWMAARRMHAHCTMLACQIGLHLMTHLVAEVVAVAAYRKLGRGHPIRCLLQPFIGLVPFVNNGYGKDVIFGSIAATSSLTTEGLYQIVKNATRDTQTYFDAIGHLERRGVRNLPGYTFGEAAERFHDVMRGGAEEIVAALYASDSALAADTELSAWLDDTAEHLRWPRFPRTRAALTRFLADLLYLATFRHSIYHFKTYEIYGISDNAPTIIHQDGSPIEVWRQLAIEYYAYCMGNSIPRWRCETDRHAELGIHHPALTGPVDRMLERYTATIGGPYDAMQHTSISH